MTTTIPEPIYYDTEEGTCLSRAQLVAQWEQDRRDGIALAESAEDYITACMTSEGGTVEILPPGVQFVNGLPVQEVEVSVRLTMRAYVAASGFGFGDLCRKVADEVSDAIEYHAGHNTDTEEGDALAVVASADARVVTARRIEAEHDAPGLARLVEARALGV